MTAATDSSSPPSAIDTLEARSRELGSASGHSGAPGSRAKSSGDGCAKGALLGCGCLTVLFVIGIIVAGFYLNDLVKTYIISPDPVVLPEYERPSETERTEAEKGWARIDVPGARIDEHFSDAALSYLFEVDGCPGSRCFYIRFPETDRFELRTSLPLLGGYLNGEFDGTVRVEKGEVESMVFERAMLREIELADDALQIFSDSFKDGLYNLVYESGLRSVVIEPGSITLQIDPDGDVGAFELPPTEVEAELEPDLEPDPEPEPERIQNEATAP